MKVTGVQFDVSLKTLILGGVFKMELHKYATDIEEIINESQEAKIENELLKSKSHMHNALKVMKHRRWGGERLDLAAS